LTREFRAGQREALGCTRLGFLWSRNVKPARVERDSEVKSQAERSRVPNKIRPNLTRCDETCKSGTLLSSIWVGSAGSAKFSEAMLKFTRFDDTRKRNSNLQSLNAAASNKRPSKVGLSLTILDNIRKDGI